MKNTTINQRGIVWAFCLAIGLFSVQAQASSEQASSERELLLLRTAERIEQTGQQIAKAYFYKGTDVRVDAAEKDIKAGVSTLDADLETLGSMELDEEESNVVMFFGFTRDEIRAILSQPFSVENGALIMDYSASFVEGAELIAKKHQNIQSDKETMLVEVEQMIYLLERINMFYISHYAGIKDQNNVRQLKESVASFEAEFKDISGYSGYRGAQIASIKKIEAYWPIAKQFFLGIEASNLPVIVLASSTSLEKELIKLADFFHKESIAE